MAKQTIGIGASANDGSGDPLRIAFDKVNDNFNEIYSNSGTTGNTLIDLFDSSGNLDLYNKPHKISFYYSLYADLPAASTYHGAVAHTHDTGSLYYAHGDWRRLLSDASAGPILNYVDPLSKHVYLANITNTETADYVLKTNADGTYTWAAQSGGSGSYANADVDTHLNVSGANANEVLSWNGTDYDWVAQSGGGAGDITGVVAGTGLSGGASATDTLNLIAGANITLTANSSSDTVTIASAGGGGGGGTDLNSLNAGVIDVASDSIGFINTTITPQNVGTVTSITAGTGLSGSAGVLSSTITQYANADVNAHLNISSAANNEVLSWTGSDYDWVAAASGSTTLLGLSDVGSDGTNGQVLTTDGSGAFAFTTISGGGGASRVSEAETTSSIADGASASVQYATLGKSFALQKVTVNKQCWVRIYSDTSARTADASRTQGTDPADGSGVIAEFISTGAGNTEFKITPSIMGWLDDSETEVPVAIQNNSGSTGTVQVTIDALKLES